MSHKHIIVKLRGAHSIEAYLSDIPYLRPFRSDKLFSIYTLRSRAAYHPFRCAPPPQREKDNQFSAILKFAQLNLLRKIIPYNLHIDLLGWGLSQLREFIGSECHVPDAVIYLFANF